MITYYFYFIFLLSFQIIKANNTDNARFYHEQSNSPDKTNAQTTDQKRNLKETLIRDFARTKKQNLQEANKGLDDYSINHQLATRLIEDSPEEIKLILSRFEKSKKIDDENIIKILSKKVILLAGEPGVGKSKLAIAIAQKLQRPYKFIKCSTIENEYKNSGAQRIEAIFKEFLETNEPVVIIFDEIHSILNQKKNEARTDQDPSVALWQFLDLCKEKSNILIIGTTNTLTNTHAAIKSRLNNKIIEIPLPDTEKRERILSFYLAKYLDKNLIKTIAQKTENFSCRDLENLSEDMILRAMDRDSLTINLNDFETSYNNIIEKIEVQKEKSSNELLNKIKDQAIDAGTRVVTEQAMNQAMNQAYIHRWTIAKYSLKGGCALLGVLTPFYGSMCQGYVDVTFK